MENLKKNFVVTFKINSTDDISSAFLALKTAQLEGIIDENSRIELNGVSIPAGYFESATTIAGYFKAIQLGDVDYLIDNLPATEDARGYHEILNSAISGIPLINRILNKGQIYLQLYKKCLYNQQALGKVLSDREKDILVRGIALQLRNQEITYNKDYDDDDFEFDSAKFD